MRQRSNFFCNLLRFGAARRVVRWRWFPVVFQFAFLVCVLLLILNGWSVGLAESPEGVRVLRKLNLTTLIVWGLWWPGMIILTLTLGRVWCTVCPMELVNRAADGLARWIGWPRWTPSRWLRDGWGILAAFLVLVILVSGLWIHRVPHYTSLVLVSILGLALLSGLLFSESRSFCKTLCPAEALLSVYGRWTALQLDCVDKEVCAGCPTRDCVEEANRLKFDARSCPSRLRPYARTQSDGCVLCFQCAKTCPYDNIGFGVTRNTASVRRHRMLRPYEATFVILVAGFVTHEIAGDVPWLDAVFHRVPIALDAAMPTVGFGWFEALWFLFLFPLALWALVAGLAVVFRLRRSALGTVLLAAVTGAAPVIAAAHLAKAAAKIFSWSPYLPLAIADPEGVGTLERLRQGTLPVPVGLVNEHLLSWLMLVAVVLVGWRAWRWAQYGPDDALRPARVGLAVWAGVYGLTIVLRPWA